MLGLVTPLWLAGLGTLLLPVALHLWSRHGGKPIRVGSIHLLLGAPPATRRSWRLQDVALLLLRAAVLAVLVLALAGPYWAPRPAPGRRWALVGTDVADRAALLDSLARAGLQAVPDSVVGPVDRPQNLWLALQDADRLAPPGTRLVVFAPDRMRQFRGVRPAIAAPVEWHSRPAAPEPAASARRLAVRTVVIFADVSRAEDARYLAAAIEAVAAATRIPALVAFRPSNDVSGTDARLADWIAWLSARDIPQAIRERVRQGATLWRDAGSEPPIERRSRILLVDRPSDAWLMRRSVAADTGAPLWTDGTGAPLLTVARQGRGLEYSFHSRLQPDWSTLELRAVFPHALARLWTAEPFETADDDRRIAVGQLLPARAPQAGAASSSADRKSLFGPFWLLTVLLFAAERRLASRPRRESA